MTNKKFWDDYPEEIKRRAIVNYENSDWDDKSDRFLADAFDWENSIEGERFWILVNEGRYDKALELLKEQESELVEETQKQDGYVDILHDQIDRLKAENEMLKQQIREGVPQMRMKVWNDTYQTLTAAYKGNSITENYELANQTVAAFDKAFGVAMKKEQV